MQKNYRIILSCVLVMALFLASFLGLTTASYAGESGSVIDSLSFDYKILEEHSDGTFKYSGVLPTLSIESAIEPRFFTGDPIEPVPEILLTVGDKTYPVDIKKDCDVTYKNNVYVSLYSGVSASIEVSLKRDPHIHETFYFMILPVHGYVDVSLSLAEDAYRNENVIYLNGDFAYAELSLKIPGSNAAKASDNLVYEVYTLKNDEDERLPLGIDFSEDYLIKLVPGKVNGAAKIVIKASDSTYHSFTDASYEVIIVNNLTGDYEADLSKEFVSTDVYNNITIDEAEVPKADTVKENGIGSFFKKIFSIFHIR